ncbi:TonB-dependent receptor [Sphingobium sp. HWE2-09]|uniref:TonB-dependent receptor n=1 Tax=Sphingobium sp. HWE2-09 TaxID=3108390 RepID=UPI002DD00424|nr:TonB-dependent receptor [Sphingobium sp. HWE2-09]
MKLKTEKVEQSLKAVVVSNPPMRIVRDLARPHKHVMSVRMASLVGTAIVGMAAMPSHAQTAATRPTTALDEIIVTAERRMESLQNTAASVSVRQGGQLQKEGKFTLRQILEDVPGVAGGADVGAAGAGTDTPGTGISIRGIGSNAPLGGSINSTVPATAIYTDDIAGGIGGAYDIGRVEVLRGPQGTLYGRSATAGVIAIHTRDPLVGQWGGNAAAEVGTADLAHVTGAINIPVGEHFAVRASGNYYSRDGYYAKDGDAISTTEGRIKALYAPTDNFSLLAGFAFQDNETHSGEINGQVLSPGKLTYSDVPIGDAKNKFRMYWAQLDWDLGAAALTYIPAFRTWEQSGQAFTQGGLLIRQTIETPRDHFLTQELRLASSGTSRLKWQVGGYYYRNDLRNHNLVENQTPAPAAPPTVPGVVVPPEGLPTDGVYNLSYESTLNKKLTTDLGVFGEGSFSFTDQTRLTAGIRYDHTKITTDQDYTSIVSDLSTFPPTSIPVTLQVRPDTSKRVFNNMTFKLRVEHDLTPENLVYASVSTGFLPGDINVTSGAAGPYIADFDTETLTAYEIGTKNRLFGNTLQLNGAIYYYRYGGYQVGGVNVAPPGDPTLNLVTLTSKAEIKGAELEAAFRPSPNDRIGFNIVYTDAKFKDKTANFASNIAQEKIAGISPVTANISYIRHIDLADNHILELGVDGIYRSGYDFTYLSQVDIANGLAPSVRVDDQFVANAHATWTIAGRYSITAYVRNIGDRRYIQTGSVVPGVGTPGGPPPANIVIARYADPRTFGVVLAADF